MGSGKAKSKQGRRGIGFIRDLAKQDMQHSMKGTESDIRTWCTA
jgi:hypothetical protein